MAGCKIFTLPERSMPLVLQRLGICQWRQSGIEIVYAGKGILWIASEVVLYLVSWSRWPSEIGIPRQTTSA